MVGKVTKTGNSATVVLPADWRARAGVNFGDELEITESETSITFRKPDSPGRSKAIVGMFAYIDSLPSLPWTRGDSKEDDREFLAGRYE